MLRKHIRLLKYNGRTGERKFKKLLTSMKFDQFSSNELNQIYVHIPFCNSNCHFCALSKSVFTKNKLSEQIEDYLKSLHLEIDLYSNIKTLKNVQFSALYFGGGTPSLIPPSKIAKIINHISKNFLLSSDSEITLEGKAEDFLDEKVIQKNIDSGINRFSFGIQTFDKNLRKIIGRTDDVNSYSKFITLIRKMNPDIKLNSELLIGLPNQTISQVNYDIKKVLELNLDSIDILYYIPSPGTRLQKSIFEDKIASPYYGKTLLDIRQHINNKMSQMGFKMLTGEVYSKSEKDLFTRSSYGGNFKGNNILALGASSFGIIGNISYRNAPELTEYHERVSQEKFPILGYRILNLKEQERRLFLFSILRLQAIEKDSLFYKRKKKLVKKWQRSKLIKEKSFNRFEFTELGKLWYNRMQMEIFSFSEKILLLKTIGDINFLEKILFLKDRSKNMLSHELYLYLREGKLKYFKIIFYFFYLHLQKFLNQNYALSFSGKKIYNLSSYLCKGIKGQPK